MTVQIGLRIDVDTFRGTKLGVPGLCRVLAAHGIQGTFFFSVGPDNMGRHLWRMIRPTFLWKMLRTRAASLYGWDILLKGTMWPGPVIGERLADIIRATAEAGHEIGLHAWDHHKWQAHIDEMSVEAIREQLERGMEMLTRIVGRAPECAAAPGWRCHERVLLAKAGLPLRYGSDCRGESIFRPVLDEGVQGSGFRVQESQPQIPTTLPTYDEVVGRDGVTAESYNDYLLSLIKPGRLNVLTIHAEVEGVICAGMFEAFVRKARERGAEFVPLRDLLDQTTAIDRGAVVAGSVPGREGTVACQAQI